jgi:hypothetical protein
MTYRKFEELAVDPKDGTSPSRDTLWKISHGRPIKVNPSIVRAVAAALNLPPARVQAAAAYEYTGLDVSRVAGGLVLHAPGVDADTPETRKTVRLQQEREEDEGG